MEAIMETDYVRVNEAAERLGCSITLAYGILRRLNSELKQKGYITIAGRVPRAYFEERCCLGNNTPCRMEKERM